MKKTNITALILFLFMLITILSGCAESKTGDKQTSSVTNAETSAESDNDLDFVYPEIPDDIDYDGYIFRFINEGVYSLYYESDEITGDVVEDAAYNRNRKAEQMLNISFDFYQPPSYGDVHTLVMKAVLAGEDAYDIEIAHCINGHIAVATQQLAYNWLRVSTVDFTQPYWNQTMLDDTINNVLLFTTGDYNMTGAIGCIYYNKNMAENFNLGNLYKGVYDGQWTIDKLLELASDVSADLDGDGKFTVSDQYGYNYSSRDILIAFMYGSNQKVIAKDENEYPTVIINGDKMVTIVEKIYALIHEDNRCFYHNEQTEPVKFADGKTLFMSNWVGSQYRDMDAEYGILPFPKFDASQEKYYSVSYSCQLMIPYTVADPDRSGLVMELLSAESRANFRPAYFGKMLEGKVARDEESVDMLSIVYDNVLSDIGFTYSDFSNLLYTIPWLMRDNSKDVASWYAKNIKAVEKNNEKIYEAFMNYNA
ncbi:MAG: hypothetical protein ACYCWE_16120 [Eubacteriales bacterium]